MVASSPGHLHLGPRRFDTPLGDRLGSGGLVEQLLLGAQVGSGSPNLFNRLLAVALGGRQQRSRSNGIGRILVSGCVAGTHAAGERLQGVALHLILGFVHRPLGGCHVGLVDLGTGFDAGQLHFGEVRLLVKYRDLLTQLLALGDDGVHLCGQVLGSLG